jgi:hypothetical protein
MTKPRFFLEPGLFGKKNCSKSQRYQMSLSQIAETKCQHRRQSHGGIRWRFLSVYP